MIEKTSTDLKKGRDAKNQIEKKLGASSSGPSKTFDASLQIALHFEFHDTIEGLMSTGEQEKRFSTVRRPTS
jgi:hypothetical protein